MSQDPTPSRLRRLTAWALGSILLGAFGSGLWDWALSPGLGWLSRSSLALVATVFHGFADFIYRDVGKGVRDQLLLMPFILVMVTVTILPWALLFEARRMGKRLHRKLVTGGGEPEEPREDPELVKRRMLQTVGRLNRLLAFVLAPLYLVITLFYMAISGASLYARQACIYVERSIDILAPSLPGPEVLSLRAKYRAVDSSEKFLALNARLVELAGEAKVELPRFNPIR